MSAADLARGKAQAKRAALSAYDTRAGTIAELARQATSPGKARLLGDTLAAIDKVTTDDVLRVRGTGVAASRAGVQALTRDSDPGDARMGPRTLGRERSSQEQADRGRLRRRARGAAFGRPRTIEGAGCPVCTLPV